MIFLAIVLKILAIIGLFGLTIFIHELGHFLAAIWSGMVVEVFSIGFGPAIWQKKVRGVTLKIAWIPLGGYVSIPQLDPAAMSTIQKDSKDGSSVQVTEQDLPAVSVWKKIFVSVAGATGNVLLAIVFAWIIYCSPSVVTEEGNTVIGSVEEGSAAYAEGIRPGHEIVEVNGERVRTWTEYVVECVLAASGSNKVSVTVAIDGEEQEMLLPTVDVGDGIFMLDGVQKSALCAVGGIQEGSPAEKSGIEAGDVIESFNGVPVRSGGHLVELVGARRDESSAIVIQRKGDVLALQITPRLDEETQRTLIGVQFGEVHSFPWMQFKRPSAQIRHDATQIVRMLRALSNRKQMGNASKGLAGPPRIMVFLWFSIQAGLLNAIGFIRFLNINLAILNLLPLPVLDGGHIVFAVYEGVTRRKPNAKFVNALINIFVVLLVGAMLFLSGRDLFAIPKLFRSWNQTEAQQAQPEPEEQQATPEPEDQQTDEER